MEKRAIVAILFMAVTAAAFSSAAKGPWVDKFVSVGDIKIHYIEAGAGDRPLVFIPGWLMPAEVWKEQIPYFASRGFQVIAMDPRSQGQTSKTEVGNTYQQQAADLHAFLKSLKIQDACLVGWSAGAVTLLEYASSPETIKPEKMVFIEANPAVAKQDDYPGSSTPQLARKLLLGFQEDRNKAMDQYIRSLFRARQPEILYKDLLDSSQKTSTMAALALGIDLYTGDRRPALRHIVVPSLIMTTVENQAVGEYMQSKIAGARLEVVHDVGPALFLDRPQAFNQVLESFLGEH
jgi:microsomal epoxide hydrolase